MRSLLIASTFLLTPAVALAAGSATPTQPAQTETTTTCEAGMVWDANTQACVAIKESRLDDDALYETARELAFAGRYTDTMDVLGQMADPESAEALTLRGFATRKLGDFEGAKALYYAALAKDPTHWQAMSYLGQGYVEVGDSTAARAQLTQIRMTGGRGTWAEVSLRTAIEKGAGYSY